MQPEGVKSQFSKLWEELSDGFEYSVRTLASGTCQDPTNSTQNPDNDFFQIPRYLADLELRPDFYLNFRLLELSAKPRVSLEWRGWEEGDREGETDWDDEFFVNEWLARIRMTENLPSFLNRGHLAVEDFEYLADLIEKNPESYVSIKKDVYTNLAELHSKAGDQAKAEKFKNLAETL